MKRTFLKAGVLSAAILLIGCGAAADEPKPVQESAASAAAESLTAPEEAAPDVSLEAEAEAEEAYDEAFLDNLSEALQVRWRLTNDADAEETEATFEGNVQGLLRYVGAEQGVLGDCRNKKFADPLLQEYAIAYINGLEKQKQLLEDVADGNITEETFYEEWDKSVLKRARQICAIYDNYDLKIDTKYNYQINTFHNKVYMDEYGRDAFWEMLNDIEEGEVESITEEDGKDRIKVRCLNKTEYEFKDLPVYLYVYDTKGTDDYSDDEMLEYIEYVVGDWKPGEETIMIFKRATEYVEGIQWVLDYE